MSARIGGCPYDSSSDQRANNRGIAVWRINIAHSRYGSVRNGSSNIGCAVLAQANGAAVGMGGVTEGGGGRSSRLGDGIVVATTVAASSGRKIIKISGEGKVYGVS